MCLIIRLIINKIVIINQRGIKGSVVYGIEISDNGSLKGQIGLSRIEIK